MNPILEHNGLRFYASHSDTKDFKSGEQIAFLQWIVVFSRF